MIKGSIANDYFFADTFRIIACHVDSLARQDRHWLCAIDTVVDVLDVNIDDIKCRGNIVELQKRPVSVFFVVTSWINKRLFGSKKINMIML